VVFECVMDDFGDDEVVEGWRSFRVCSGESWVGNHASYPEAGDVGFVVDVLVLVEGKVAVVAFGGENGGVIFGGGVVFWLVVV
jgi:hypothetical protein